MRKSSAYIGGVYSWFGDSITHADRTMNPWWLLTLVPIGLAGFMIWAKFAPRDDDFPMTGE